MRCTSNKMAVGNKNKILKQKLLLVFSYFISFNHSSCLPLFLILSKAVDQLFLFCRVMMVLVHCCWLFFAINIFLCFLTIFTWDCFLYKNIFVLSWFYLYIKFNAGTRSILYTAWNLCGYFGWLNVIVLHKKIKTELDRKEC